MDLTRSEKDIDATLDAYRRQSDDLADAVIVELIKSGAVRGAGGDLVAAVENHARAGGKACAQLLEQAFTVPSWVRFQDMRPGTQLGLRTPVQSALSLILGSLLETYGAAKGAKVLIRGGMLKDHVLQRLHDTNTFVLEIASSRMPMPGTHAHRHILKTRLVHGFIRHGMLKRGDWNFDWGHPINQEDYASTLLAFCNVYLRSMHRIGATPTEEEEASVHHLYRWVGYVMGITPDLLTADRTAEQVLYAHITRRQLHPDADSRTLAKSLIDALANRRPTWLPASALSSIARRMLGDEFSDKLGLEPSRAWTTMTGALPLFSRAQLRFERVPFTRFPLEHLGERVARLVYEKGFLPAR